MLFDSLAGYGAGVTGRETSCMGPCLYLEESRDDGIYRVSSDAAFESTLVVILLPGHSYSDLRNCSHGFFNVEMEVWVFQSNTLQRKSTLGQQ